MSETEYTDEELVRRMRDLEMRITRIDMDVQKLLDERPERLRELDDLERVLKMRRAHTECPAPRLQNCPDC